MRKRHRANRPVAVFRSAAGTASAVEECGTPLAAGTKELRPTQRCVAGDSGATREAASPPVEPTKSASVRAAGVSKAGGSRAKPSRVACPARGRPAALRAGFRLASGRRRPRRRLRRPRLGSDGVSGSPLLVTRCAARTYELRYSPIPSPTDSYAVRSPFDRRTRGEAWPRNCVTSSPIG